MRLQLADAVAPRELWLPFSWQDALFLAVRAAADIACACANAPAIGEALSSGRFDPTTLAPGVFAALATAPSARAAGAVAALARDGRLAPEVLLPSACDQWRRAGPRAAPGASAALLRALAQHPAFDPTWQDGDAVVAAAMAGDRALVDALTRALRVKAAVGRRGTAAVVAAATTAAGRVAAAVARLAPAMEAGSPRLYDAVVTAATDVLVLPATLVAETGIEPAAWCAAWTGVLAGAARSAWAEASARAWGALAAAVARGAVPSAVAHAALREAASLSPVLRAAAAARGLAPAAPPPAAGATAKRVR
jgi:hypothetical protein